MAIKDTIDEFQEAAKAAAEANGTPATATTTTGDAPKETQDSGGLGKMMGDLNVSGEGTQEGFEIDFDDMGKDYSPSELRCVEASVDILRILRRCLKAANNSLNAVQSVEAPVADGAKIAPEGEGRLRRELAWAQTLQTTLGRANESAGELGILLYPPLNGNELLGRSDDLARTLREVCDVLNEQEGTGGGEHGASVEGGDGDQVPLRALMEEKIGVLRAELERL